MINSTDAAERDITNGDRVMIKTPRGSVIQRAIVTGDIKQGCIDANHACGSPIGPEAWKRSNINDLTDLNNHDPISGFPVYKALLCEIVKVKDDGAPLIIDSGEIRPGEIEIAEIKKSEKIIYLDNNATTKIAGEVKDQMIDLMDVYGNPSSIHGEGKHANRIVEQARRKVAQQLNCTSKRVIFTGSGTESDNIAVKGVALANRGKKNHIITSSIEHPAVLNSCKWLQTQGFKISYLPVDKTGIVDPADLKKTITDRTCLVSIMLANNVTGSIQPVRELAEIARKRGIIFHTDAVQVMGKIPVDIEGLGVDLLTISGHKLYGPKGVGVLYIKKGIDLEYLIHGGGQEYGIRSATENVMGIAGLGKAMEMVPRYLKNIDSVTQLRDRLESGIKEITKDYIFNGSTNDRLPNTLNITIPGVRGESIVLEAAKRGLCFSSGSACHSGSSAPSYVLMAMGLTEEEAHCSLRFSLGYETSEEEILKSLDIIGEIINSSKNIIRFVPCK
jgi:cysteine desulfurase NifS